MAFHVYMLKCADGSFYIGHTDNLEARLGLHVLGLGNAYTASRLPVALVWSQKFTTRYEALSVERQLKGWSRAKKAALIRGDWAAIRRLAKARPSTSSGRTVERGRPSTSSGRAGLLPR
jgi:predicted GIY-YIG superfamily endonuclease